MMRLFPRQESPRETPRLLLRRWQAGDLEDFAAFACDPLVTEPAGSPVCLGPVEAREQLQRLIRDPDCWAVVWKETGRAVGKIRLQGDPHRGNYRGALSVGYQLNRAWWGRGVMPEALAAVMDLAFTERGVPVLGVSHFAGNDRSRRVIEKCGFRYEGTLRRAYRRYDGEVFDDVCYSLTREEYDEIRKGPPGGGEL